MSAEFSNFETINFDNHTHPIVVSIPHCGTLIPDDVRKFMKESIEYNMSGNIYIERFVKELYSFLKDMGVTVVANNISRMVVNLNSCPEIVRVDIACPRPDHFYLHSISDENIENIINKYFHPFFDEVHKNIKAKLMHHDKITLLDLHSFNDNLTSNVVLANNMHSYCTENKFNLVRDIFRAHDFIVGNNWPWMGGGVTRHFKYTYRDKPDALMIELKNSVYIEDFDAVRDGVYPYEQESFIKAKDVLEKVFKEIIEVL